jgi:hypothetical protein
MHEYDVAFKLVLQSVDLTMRELAGTPITRWLNVELPEIQNTRVDLLGETETGELIHIELQSSNDPKMPLRMAEYCLRVLRLFGKIPHQVLVYVGEPPLQMEGKLKGPALSYSYRLIDIRELDGERLLKSPRVGDNIVAILTGVPDVRAAVHRVVERIAELQAGERETALKQLLILAGLRRLDRVVEQEARKMPILNDILEHEVLGREYKKGELHLLRRQVEKRFGVIPSWAEARLAQLSVTEVETIGLRLLDAKSLEELLG